MIVILEDEIFASSSYARLDLLNVLGFGFAGWHRIQTDPPYQPDADCAINHWLEGLDEMTREEVEFAFAVGLEQDVLGIPADLEIRIGDIRIADWTAAPPRLPLSEALNLLQRPLHLLVENRHNDGAFLRAVVPSPWRRAFLKALEQRWIEIEHGGGSDMRTRLETASREEAMRLWALFDSDAREPGRPSAASEALCQSCFRKGISCHRLQRRAIENYLPVKALQGWAHISSGNLRISRVRTANTFAGMEPDQRHHYNMKQGFRGDRDKGIPAMFGAFTDHPDLQNGFSESIASLYHEENFQIREEWLAKDGQQPETLAIVQSILRRM